MANVILLYKRGGLIYTVRPVSHVFHVEFDVKMNNIFDDDIPNVSLRNINTFKDIFDSCKTESYHLGYGYKTVTSINKIKKEFSQYELTSVHAIQSNNDKSFGTKNNNKYSKDISNGNANHKSIKNNDEQHKNISNENINNNKFIDTNKIRQDIHKLAKDYGQATEKNVENKLLIDFHLKNYDG